MGDPRDRAAHFDGTRSTVNGRSYLAEVLTGFDRQGHRCSALSGEVDLDDGRRALLPPPDLPAVLEDDAATVRRGVTDIELGVRQAAKICSFGQPVGRNGGRPQVARSVAIGSEPDRRSVIEPHRRFQRCLLVGEQPLELAVSVPVEPQFGRRSSAVPLPPRHLDGACGSSEDGTGGPQRNIAHEAVRQPLRRSAVEVDGVGGPAAAALFAAVRRDEHPTVGRPSEDRRGRHAEVREPPPVAAVEVDDVYLGGPVDGACPGHPPAVRRQPWSTRRHPVGGDPPRSAAGRRRQPNIVLGDEREEVSGKVGEAQVAAGHDGQRTRVMSCWLRGYPRGPQPGDATEWPRCRDHRCRPDGRCALVRRRMGARRPGRLGSPDGRPRGDPLGRAGERPRARAAALRPLRQADRHGRVPPRLPRL